MHGFAAGARSRALENVFRSREVAMKRYRLLLVGLYFAVLTAPAPAGILFGKHTKPNPAERVPELLATLKTDTSENKRTNAAKELRDYDAAAFPDMIPILIDVLQRDDKAGVRVEVAQTLGKLRPISQEAGMALEEATHDSSIRVRLQARSSLLGYRLSGYHTPAKPSESATATASSPAKPATPSKWMSLLPGSRTGSNLVNETPPPPLATPGPASTEVKKWTPTPMPAGATPKLQTPPAPADQGPDLPPD
jgi:hypothetical protein